MFPKEVSLIIFMKRKKEGGSRPSQMECLRKTRGRVLPPHIVQLLHEYSGLFCQPSIKVTLSTRSCNAVDPGTVDHKPEELGVGSLSELVPVNPYLGRSI
jgi:hypothetical protein